MIQIKTEQDIQKMKEAGRALSQIMQQVKKEVKPGIATNQLDKLAEELIFKSGFKPAFKGYNNFPNSLCVSINDEVVHGLPSERIIKEGDLVSLDLGLFCPTTPDQGFYSDMAITVAVGSVSPEAGRLIRVTKKALKRAINRCKPGKTIGDIGQAVQNFVEHQGFSVVRDLCGHGIGKQLHEDPEIPNFGQRHKGPQLKPGMVLALEPMVNLGDYKVKLGPNGFVFKTADGSLSAHFEHTVLVTNKEPRILTEM